MFAAQGAMPAEDGWDESAPGEDVKPKKRRHANNTSCDLCRKRKTGCDGGDPCSTCVLRGGNCLYRVRDSTEQPQRKRRKTEPNAAMRGMAGQLILGSPVSRPATNLNHALMSAFYLKTYQRHVNPILEVYDPRRIATIPDEPTRGEMLVHQMTMAMAARGLGHVSVADDLFNQSKMLAMELSQSFEPDVAMGYFLMTFFSLGEDNRAAQHFATIGYSLSQNSTADQPRMNRIRNLIRHSRFLEGARRGYGGGGGLAMLANMVQAPGLLTAPAGDGAAFPAASLMRGGPPPLGSSAMALGNGGPTDRFSFYMLGEEMLEAFRTFPLHSPYQDLSCQMLLVERYPVAERTNEFLPYAQADTLLKIVYQGLRMYLALRAGIPEDPVTSLFVAAMKGARSFICAASGLKELGCLFARDTWLYMKTIQLNLAGFNYGMLLQAVLHVGQFVWLYKCHPFGRELDYRDFMLELAEAIRPLCATYKSVERAFHIFMQASQEPDNTPPHFNAGPMDPEAVAIWSTVLGNETPLELPPEVRARRDQQFAEHAHAPFLAMGDEPIPVPQGLSTRTDSSSSAASSPARPSMPIDIGALLGISLMPAGGPSETLPTPGLRASPHASPMLGSSPLTASPLMGVMPSEFDWQELVNLAEAASANASGVLDMLS